MKMLMQFRWRVNHFAATIKSLLALFAFVTVDAGTTARAETLIGQIGTPLTIEMEGNPSTGYIWEYQLTGNETNVIKIDKCGWREKTGANTNLMGRPKLYFCRITPNQIGSVKITFVYRRLWEKNKPAKITRNYDIKIK